jgi:hypothetical protein
MDAQTALRFDLFCAELRRQKKEARHTFIQKNDEAMNDGQCYYYRYHYLLYGFVDASKL